MSAEPGSPNPVDQGESENPGPQVGISMSSFGGLGAPSVVRDQAFAPPADGPTPPAADAPASPTPLSRPAAEAPPAQETIPGLSDNVLLRDALAALTDDPQPLALMNVARQLLQGQVFLRVKGDARALLAEDKEIPLAVATREGAQFVLVYSSGSALQAAVRSDGDVDTSAMAQSVILVMRHALGGPYEGVIIDHASGPATAVLPNALLQRALDDIDENVVVKSLLAGERTAATPGEVALALTEAQLWIAVNRASEQDAWGVAESRTADGDRHLEVFSHPLEVVALGRGDQPMPFTPAQLGSALAGDEGLNGVIVDPAGPWIRLSRADLAPVAALAAAS